VLLAFSHVVLADTAVLEMVDGLPKPPFIIDENGKGIQLDIVRAAFKSVNKSVKFVHVPFGRTITTFKRINADGVVTVLPEYQHPSLHVSKPFITYQNVAISLLESQFTIENIKSLSGKSIIAFQNAKKYLGHEFGQVLSSSLDYREIADQTQQIDMLFLNRTEVIILDINIFKYFIANHTSGRYLQPFNVHYIFDERLYSAAFKSEENKELFDKGIETIKVQGVYQQIMDKYLNQQ
jgi:polar amino acid transport system substrate-binding protein